MNKLIWITFLSFILTTIAGCDGSKNPSSALGTKFDGTINSGFVVNGVEPSAARAGESVTVKGTGLNDVTVSVQGQVAEITKRLTDRAITIKIPAGAPGVASIEVKKSGTINQTKFLMLADGNEFVGGGSLDHLCQGEKFYDVDGNLIEGTKDCGGLKPDEQTLTINEDGQLSIKTIPAEFLPPTKLEGDVTGDFDSNMIARISGDAIDLTQGSGDIIKWNNTVKRWERGSAGGTGTVTALSEGAGIDLGNGGGDITGSGTISIKADSVDSSMIENGTIVDGDIAAGTIGDDKLQTITTANKVDGSALTGTISAGVEIDTDQNIETSADVVANNGTFANALTTDTANVDTLNGTTVSVSTITATSGDFTSLNGTTLAVDNTASNSVAITSPAGANYSLVLPADDGSANQVLQTDGGGTLTWVNQSGSGSPAFDSHGSANPGSIYVDNNSHVGIGTSDPLNDFHVYSFGSETILRLTAMNGVHDTIISMEDGGSNYWNLGMDDSDTQTFKISASGGVDFSNPLFSLSREGLTTLTRNNSNNGVVAPALSLTRHLDGASDPGSGFGTSILMNLETDGEGVETAGRIITRWESPQSGLASRNSNMLFTVLDGGTSVGVMALKSAGYAAFDEGIQLGFTSDTCDGSTEGRLRYNSGTGFEYCDDTNWVDIVNGSSYMVTTTYDADQDGNIDIDKVDANQTSDSHIPISIAAHSNIAANLTEWEGHSGAQTVIDNDGHIGVGITTPAVALHVEGQMRMNSGSPLQGQIVKSSDDSGTMEWASISRALAPPKDLLIKTTDDSNVQINAASIALRDGEEWWVSSSPLSLNINIASSGINGLDAGTEAASQWYYIWILGDGSGGVGAVFSTSKTTPSIAHASLSGYTFRKMVGAIYNDAGEDLISQHQVGDRVFFEFPEGLTLNNSAGWNTTNLNMLPPELAKTYFGNFLCRVRISVTAGAYDCDLGVFDSTPYYTATSHKTGGVLIGDTWSGQYPVVDRANPKIYGRTPIALAEIDFKVLLYGYTIEFRD